MSLFRRKRDEPAVEAEPDEETLAREAALRAEEEAEQRAEARAAASERLRQRQGPKDSGELDEDDETERIDLGALRIAAQDKLELRMEVAEENRAVRSVTALISGSQVQLQPFAAPRRTGVWDDIRTELVQEIERQGGTAEERQGTFGEEILAKLPVRTQDGQVRYQQTLFIGVDGPRWFLRGVVSGPAVVDPKAFEAIETLIKRCVVHRGPEALPPRDLLPMQLPAAAQRAAEPSAEQDGPAEQDGRRVPTAPPERGPEITEIR